MVGDRNSNISHPAQPTPASAPAPANGLPSEPLADAGGADVAGPASAPVQLSTSALLRRGFARWLFTGVVRVAYRGWTRVAARVFPEESPQARLVLALGIPLPDSLNLSWVTQQLAVGGRVRPGDIARLGRLGVTGVVDTRAEHCDDERALNSFGIRLLHLPTTDTYPLSVEQMRVGTTWINQLIAEGGRVLVHCEHGVGRSVQLTAAALVASGMGAHEAIEMVQRRRWQAAPNHRQMVRLQEFERGLHATAKEHE